MKLQPAKTYPVNPRMATSSPLKRKPVSNNVCFSGTTARKSLSGCVFLASLIAGLNFFEGAPLDAFMQAGLDGVYSLPWSKPGQPSVKTGWNPNVAVLAASSQRQVSCGQTNSFYINALLNQLAKSDVKGIEEAHAILQKQGYSGCLNLINQYPTRSINTQNIWQKDNPKPHRYALLLHPPIKIVDTFFSNATMAMKKGLEQSFQLTDNQILDRSINSYKELNEALHKLAKQIPSDSKQPVELLIYYSGHGGNLSLPPYLAPGDEGDAIGILELPDDEWVNEVNFQKMVNEELNLPNTKVLMIFDICYAGSWVA